MSNSTTPRTPRLGTDQRDLFCGRTMARISAALVLCVAISRLAQAGRTEADVKLDAPTAALMKPLTDWDGSDTKPYAGDGKVDGWQWLDTGMAKEIPEPATLMIGLVALGCTLTQRPVTPRAG